jgi:DNA-binding response OmpR family regulator
MHPARILYVEDDEDIRDTLAMLLEHEGYRVTALPDAEGALVELGNSKFDLLLTDYQLPGHNAAWLIEKATEQRLLDGLPVIVLTGAHEPTGIEGHRLLRKPVSQEALLAAFEAAMPQRAEPVPPPGPISADADLRVVLYVDGASPASRKARRNLAHVLRDVDASRVDVTVHDIATGQAWVSAAEQDRVVVVPMLVRRWPLPRVCIAGDLSSVEVVREAVVPAILLRS